MPNFDEQAKEFIRRDEFQGLGRFKQTQAFKQFAEQNLEGYVNLSPSKRSDLAKEYIEENTDSTFTWAMKSLPILGPAISSASSKAESPAILRGIDNPGTRFALSLGAEVAMMAGSIKLGNVLRRGVQSLPQLPKALGSLGLLGSRSPDRAARNIGAAASFARAERVVGAAAETGADALVFSVGQAWMDKRAFPEAEELLANAAVMGAFRLGAAGVGGAANQVRDLRTLPALRQLDNPDIQEHLRSSQRVTQLFARMHKTSNQEAGEAIAKIIDGGATDEQMFRMVRTLSENPEVLDSGIGMVLTRQIQPKLNPVFEDTADDLIRLGALAIRDPQTGSFLSNPRQMEIIAKTPEELQAQLARVQGGEIALQSVKGKSQMVDEVRKLYPELPPAHVASGMPEARPVQSFTDQTWDEVIRKKGPSGPAQSVRGEILDPEAPGASLVQGGDVRGYINDLDGVMGISTRMSDGSLFRVRKAKGVFKSLSKDQKDEILSQDRLWQYADETDPGLVSTPIRTTDGKILMKVSDLHSSSAAKIMEPEDFMNFVQQGSILDRGIRRTTDKFKGKQVTFGVLGSGQKKVSETLDLGFDKKAEIQTVRLGLRDDVLPLNASQAGELVRKESAPLQLVGKEARLEATDPNAVLGHVLGAQVRSVGEGVRVTFPGLPAIDYASPVQAFKALRELQRVRLQESRMIGHIESSILNNKLPKLPTPLSAGEINPTLELDNFLQSKLASEGNFGRWTGGVEIPRSDVVITAASRLTRNGSIGQDIIGGMQDMVDLTDTGFGAPMSEFVDLLKELTPDERAFGLWRHIEFGEGVSPKAAAVASRLQDLLESQKAQMRKLGLKVGGEKFPKVWDMRAMKDKGDAYQKAVKSVMKEHNIRRSEAESLVEDLIRQAENGGISSQLDSIRFGADGHTTDASIAYMVQFRKNAQAIAETQVWGRNGEKFRELVRRLPDTEQEFARNVMDALTGKVSNQLHPFLQQVYDHQSLKLAFSIIPNLGQNLNTIQRTGFRNWAKSTGRFFGSLKNLMGRDRGQQVQIARQIGALAVKGLERIERDGMWSLWNPQVFSESRGVMSSLLAGKKRFEDIATWGLEVSEKWNRSIGVEAGRLYFRELLDKARAGGFDLPGKQGKELRDAVAELGFNELQIKAVLNSGDEGLLHSMELLAGKRLSDATQFKFNILKLPGVGLHKDAPLWASSPLGKFFLQYKSFTLNQARFFFEELLQGPKKGTRESWLRSARMVALITTLYPAYGLFAQNAVAGLKGTENDAVKATQAMMEDPDAVTALGFYLAGIAGSGGLGVTGDITQIVTNRSDFQAKGFLTPPVVQTGFNSLFVGSAGLQAAATLDQDRFDEAQQRLLRELGPFGRAVETRAFEQ